MSVYYIPGEVSLGFGLLQKNGLFKNVWVGEEAEGERRTMPFVFINQIYLKCFE